MNTSYDTARDIIRDIRFSRRKLAHPEYFTSGTQNKEEEQAYHDECVSDLRKVLANRHRRAWKTDQYGWPTCLKS